MNSLNSIQHLAKLPAQVLRRLMLGMLLVIALPMPVGFTESTVESDSATSSSAELCEFELLGLTQRRLGGAPVVASDLFSKSATRPHDLAALRNLQWPNFRGCCAPHCVHLLSAPLLR